MVFYFQCIGGPSYVVYMGKDKFENEELLKWAFPEDVWFHADKLSSAHVYLRLPVGMTIDTIPEDILEDMCQLTKDNSIEGRKKAAIKVQYTMASNLLKTADMEVGAVSFVNSKAVFSKLVEKKRPIISRISKTKEEKTVDLRAERAARDERERRRNTDIKRRKAMEEKEAIQKNLAEKEANRKVGGYDDIFENSAMTSNQGTRSKNYEDFEDDFM